MIQHKMYTVVEAAMYLGVHAQSLRNWDKQGKFIAFRTPGNQRRYSEDQLLGFIHGTRGTYNL